MTPEELRAVIRLHASRDPWASEDDRPTLADVAEALNISADEAREMLLVVRESQAASPVPAPAPPMILDFGHQQIENPRSWEIMWVVLLGLLAFVVFMLFAGAPRPA